jgi:hypothetical protein
MRRVLLSFLGFLVLFVLNTNAEDNLDNLKTQYNRYLIDSSYKNFVENFNRLDDPIAFEKAEFSWRDKFLYNNKVINLPCAYIMHLQGHFLRSVDKKQAESIAHLLKLTQIDGFYFVYQKQTVTKRQAQFLSLMFERSNIFTNILDQKNDNIYAKAIKQHFDLIKDDHKKLQEWQDVKDSNKFNDNLWINLRNLGDTKTKKRIDLIKGLSLSRRNIMPEFILNSYFEQIRTDNFLGFECNSLVSFFRKLYKVTSPICDLGEYTECEFCGYSSWKSKRICECCKKYLRFEQESNSRISYTNSVQVVEETDKVRVNPARWEQREHYERFSHSIGFGMSRRGSYDYFAPVWIGQNTERLVKIITNYYGFSFEEKTAIRQDLSKQSIMFKKRRLVYLLYYLKNHPALKFRREIFAEIGEYLLEYKKPKDTFFKSIKPMLLVKETTEDCWRIVQH